MLKSLTIRFIKNVLNLLVILACAVYAVTAFGQSTDDVRTWTSKDGKFSIEATLESFANGKAKLNQPNGEQVSVPIKRLSLEDHQFISSSTDWGRTWTSKSGKALYVAKFDSMFDSKRALLTTISGTQKKVKISALNDECRNHIASIIKSKEEVLQNALTPGASSIIKVAADVEVSETVIRDRIANCYQVSRKLRVDGNASDWNGIPSLISSRSIEIGSLDIQRVAIAPREKDLVVMIETREPPSQVPFSFYITVDFFGQRSIKDFQLGLNANGAEQQLKVYNELEDNKTIVEQNVKGIQVKIGKVVEARIPYAVIQKYLPDHLSGLSGTSPNARPFLRVETLAFDRKSRIIVDHGPAVASYRFLRDEYPLDKKSPGKSRQAFPIAVPFDGKWLVGHGAMGYITHENIHAYDFFIMDHLFSPSKFPKSKSNDDYYSFGMPLTTPIDSRVVRVETEHRDVPPLKKDRGNRANKVVLEVHGNENLQIHLLHLKQNSVKAEVGQRFRVGEEFAVTGNSGLTGFSHLHLELCKGRRLGPPGGEATDTKPGTLPVAFEKALVSLNPIANDPWTRYVENWQIRAGVFVEKVKE